MSNRISLIHENCLRETLQITRSVKIVRLENLALYFFLFCRSYCQTQEIRGKTVYTRTIAFNITADTYSKTSSDEYETPLQYQLKLYLEREHERMREGERDTVSDIILCLDFLHSLGGITHYVSSITLGAMEYSVKKVQVRIGLTHKPSSRKGLFVCVCVCVSVCVCV